MFVCPPPPGEGGGPVDVDLICQSVRKIRFIQRLVVLWNAVYILSGGVFIIAHSVFRRLSDYNLRVRD